MLCNPKGRSQDKYVATCHEYLLGFARSPLEKGKLNVPKTEDEVREEFKLKDSKGLYRELELRNTHREFGKHNRRNLYYPIYVSETGLLSIDPIPGYQGILPDWEDGFEGCWTWGLEKATKQIGDLVAKKVKGNYKIYRKNYAFDEDGEATKQVKSIWTDKEFHTEKGQAVFNSLFNSKGKIFQSPKSVDALRQLIQMATKKNSIVMDFFAGSGSIAHAVLLQNKLDNLSRKFIVMQIPDDCDKDSDAAKAGFSNIAEISKERIRRAGRLMEISPNNAIKMDIGFRVLKVDSSNMADVYYDPSSTEQNLLSALEENIKKDRTDEDLLFQVMLDWGLELTLPIRQEAIAGNAVYFVNENALVACFAKRGEITDAFCKELALKKPLRVVFRDAGFAGDAAKINVEQVFKLHSPNTEVKTL